MTPFTISRCKLNPVGEIALPRMPPLSFGGGAGIRTLDASFSSHTPLAGEPLQPLGHASKPSTNFSMRQA